jgi:hypothetical protein
MNRLIIKPKSVPDIQIDALDGPDFLSGTIGDETGLKI